MSVVNFFVLTPAQITQAVSLQSVGKAEISPRPVDNASPGIGININDVAVGVAAGATVTLVGKSVAPKRIVDDPSYKQDCPDLITFLLTLPFCSLEDATIFAPQQPL